MCVGKTTWYGQKCRLSFTLFYVSCGIKEDTYNGQVREGERKEECESETFKTVAPAKISTPAVHSALDQNVPAGC